MLDQLGLERAHLVGNSYGGACALRLALDTPHRVGKLVLMGPGGVGTTRGLPTPGLKRLLAYYGGERPLANCRRSSASTWSSTPLSTRLGDRSRYEASIDPEVVAAPPLRRPARLRTLWRMDFTRDHRLGTLSADPRALGTRGQGQPPERRATLAGRMPNCDVLVANTGHWVQFERADLFNPACADFLAGRRPLKEIR